jgi:hypothetical protein
MATKKGKTKTKTPTRPIPRAVRKLAVYLWGPGRPWLLACLMVAALAGAWYAAWRTIGGDVLASDQYHVTAESIKITPLPRWIKSDVRGEVFQSVSVDGPLSIMNPDANKRIAVAFSLHPWVAQVVKVTKRHPALIQVELRYRRPVCMVEGRGGSRPVDVRGAWLPWGDFSSVEASRYPRLVGIDTSPVGPAGTPWGDDRVAGGAEIAAALGDAWADLRLDRIEPAGRVPAARGTECTYELFTRFGSRILWGRAPGTRTPGEPSAEDKVARLKQHAAEYGGLEGVRGPLEIDLRDKQSLQVRDRLARVGGKRG